MGRDVWLKSENLINLIFNATFFHSKTYKCGVFLENLKDNKPITWLGAVPEALRKVEKEEYQEILGENITPDSFKQFSCDKVAANSRCYTMVSFVCYPF